MQKNRPRSWALALVYSALSGSLVMLCCVVVLGSILDGTAMAIKGDEIHNSTAAGSSHPLPAKAIPKKPDPQNNNNNNNNNNIENENVRRYNYLYFDGDEDEIADEDGNNDDDEYFNDDDDEDDLVLLDRSKHEGADDLSEEDWTWTVFFDGLKRGYLLIDRVLDLYDCPSHDDEEDEDGDTNDRIPIDSETWKLFEEAYYSAVGMEAPPLRQSKRAPPTKKDRSQKKQAFEPARGMKIPYEVNYEDTNPALVATTFVPKGAEVWTGSHTAGFTQDLSNNSSFFQIPSYHRFIGYLNDRFLEEMTSTKANDSHNWACDAISWTLLSGQVGDESKEDKDLIPALCVFFDHGSLIESPENQRTETLASGEYDPEAAAFGLQGVARRAQGIRESSTTAEGYTVPGTNEVKLPGVQCQFEMMIAARDIQPGEELRFNYGGVNYDDDYVEYHENYLDGRSSMFFNGQQYK